MTDIPRIGAVPDDAKESCGKCAYFFNPGNAEAGLCRRLPPYVSIIGSQQMLNGEVQPITRSFHPPMYPTGWCGEYSPRSTEKVFRGHESVADGYAREAAKHWDDEGRFFAPRSLSEDRFGLTALDSVKPVVEPVVADGLKETPPDPSGGGEDRGQD